MARVEELDELRDRCVRNPPSSIGGAQPPQQKHRTPLSPLPAAPLRFAAVGGNSRWPTADFCSLHDETMCSPGARVCLRCLKSPPLGGLALMSSRCSMQVNSALQELPSSSAMNPPWAGGTSNICEGRGATHQPPNACTALRQDEGLYLTHLSSGQMSKKSLLSFFWLNHQYTKTPSFSPECWKSCS